MFHIQPVLLWIALWFIVMGLPNVWFAKNKISYQNYPLRNALWYVMSIGVTFHFYPNLLDLISQLSVSQVILVAVMALVWFASVFLYRKKDFASLSQRSGYQFAKLFEIVFQQLAFVGGFLALGYSIWGFGLLFFVTHLPVLFYIKQKFAFIFPLGSLFGGVMFAWFHSLGLSGSLIALGVHFLFYIVFHTYMAYNHNYMWSQRPR